MNSEKSSTPNHHAPKDSTVEMHGGDTLQVQLSIEGTQTIAALSPQITVTYYNVSKTIQVPSKLIDPSIKERFIQRTLLDHVSGQIHPGQVVALMGPSGKSQHTYISHHMSMCN